MAKLRFVRPVSLPVIETFIAAEKFRVNKTVDGIAVGWCGPRFRKHFLEKIEGFTCALEAREHELIEEARNSAIITELGGEEMVETSLGQFWKSLTTADQTCWHVRYICDVEDVLWAVGAYWISDELRVEAQSLGERDGWPPGFLFLSH